jgi:predicted ribosomally synthesized peptide with nif11-like leader
MAKEAIDRMMQAAGTDAALQHQLEFAGGFAEVVQIGADKGYQFTEADARAFLGDRGIGNSVVEGELSDEALEAVAGGLFENLSIRIGNNPTVNIRHW